MKIANSAVLLGAAVLLACSVSRCGRAEKMTRMRKELSSERQAVTGTVTMAGSTSMEKFANAAAESFMLKYPEVTVTVEFTGSSAGIEAVLTGSVDIGNSSRPLRTEEIEAGAVEHIVAIDAIVIVTDLDNKVKRLTREQLTDIYTGAIRNWSEVGGVDMPIVVVGREAGSGTRSAFEEMLGIQDICAYANEMDSTGAVMGRVAVTPGAIGYVSLDVLDGSVIPLAVDGAAPNAENIKAGRYTLSRPYVMATKRTVAEQNSAVREFFTYLASEEGRKVIESVGLTAPQGG